MSHKKVTTLAALQQKRDAIDAQIAVVAVQEKRKIEVMAMPEFVSILHLSGTVLRTAFAKIGTENPAP